jgi:hypothetical protein
MLIYLQNDFDHMLFGLWTHHSSFLPHVPGVINGAQVGFFFFLGLIILKGII